jgi:3' terminal RNA ribose 2'-O-methyltransferase Hen1
MLLTISTTHRPATDLGYLLHKHPAKVQSFSLAFGPAHVFYPDATDELTTAALLLEVDAVGLVRGRPGARTLDQYVSDRPYVASSMLAVAIAQVFGTALAGRCKDREELARTPIPLTATLAAVPCRAGAALLERLFGPLGYEVTASSTLLDEKFPAWGASPIFTLTLRNTVTLGDLLSHLYVLVPVLDNDKHYWVGDDEVAKLMRHGEGWLAAHPERELIASRYLKYRRDLITDALLQLREQDGQSAEQVESDSPEDPREEAGERQLSLHQIRHATILSVLQARGCRSVVDLGCGEGRLLRELLKHKTFEKVAGMDVSHRSLQTAAERLRLDGLPPMVRERITLFQGSLLYRDERLAGYDAAVLCEVIEHLDPPRLAAMERSVFEFARPRTAIITTPNREYNAVWESLPAGHMRHKDHRFEWTREEFRGWAAGIASRFGYTVETRPVGPEHEGLGAPSQMGIFTRAE